MVSTNVKEFVIGLERFKDRPPAEALRIFRETAKFVHRRVVDLTPVDTGRLRASWNMSVNSTNMKTAPLGRRSAADARSWALRSQSMADQAKLGDSIIISNSVEYADYVENGTASMSGYFMLRQAVADLQARLRRL
jgi:hypothetical protein